MTLSWKISNAAICLIFLLQFSAFAEPSAASSSSSKPSQPSKPSCDDTIARIFQNDANTKVLLVKQYKKGDKLSYRKNRMFPVPDTLSADLCLVKLLVGPGLQGPEGAPSTSRGIGIEVWLPSKDAWNGRIHAVGGGGWAGSEETDLTTISQATSAFDLLPAPIIAAREGAVSSSTDTGHTGGGGAFAMLPDGSVNTKLWQDFAHRGIHEQVVKTKALTEAFYGTPGRHIYWTGGSTGGRQALKHAQLYPKDLNGIIAAFPAINWTRFITSELYPQIVVQRDLGGQHMTLEQLTMASNAAIAACDLVNGKHMGFIIDAASCRYDPTKDRSALCTTDGGDNQTPACITQKQALALNKIWYGMTSDGSVPDPAVDNGFGPLTGVHRWYGAPRGTNLMLLASDRGPFNIATDMVALELQDPKLTTSLFRNAKADGQNGWKSLSYQQLSAAFDAGLAMQRQFGDINTDNPDLSAFKANGGKLIHLHGNADELIPYQGSVDYYERVGARMGGLPSVRSFYRFYVIPGLGHGSPNGTANPNANPPAYSSGTEAIYKQLTDWVEKGVEPEQVTLRSSDKSLPICAYPEKITYVEGDPYVAQSYSCR